MRLFFKFDGQVPAYGQQTVPERVAVTSRDHFKIFSSPKISGKAKAIDFKFLADHVGRAFGTLCRLSSVVCNVLYCGKTVRPSQKVSEGVNRKPG